MIGQRFGNYRALSLIGEGGMGSVYLAEHPEIGRKVAIKVLRAAYSNDKELLARFLNEARAANAIRHPNIIEILDTGTTADGAPFLVMELLEGESLRDRLRRLQRLSPADAVAVALQTVSALGAAHRKGIVHRDLKPDNLFIVGDELVTGGQRVKVLDFGIAKLQTQSSAGEVHTRTGTLMGTPVYMSPEQCLGNKQIDARSDVYALGIILFEMVCGQLPFSSEGFGELVNMHLNVPPPGPRTLAPHVPPALEQIILRALSKKPDERFASMAELESALRALGGLPTKIEAADKGADKSSDKSADNVPTPALAAPGHATTTFQSSAGEKMDPMVPTRSRRAFVLVPATLAAVGVVFLALRDPTEAPIPTSAGSASPARTAAATPTPRPAASSAVHVAIESTPSGARIVRTSNGTLLGTTPFRERLPVDGASLEVRIEKPGFEPVTRAFPLDRDVNATIKLPAKSGAPDPTPRPKRPPRPRPGVEPAKI